MVPVSAGDKLQVVSGMSSLPKPQSVMSSVLSAPGGIQLSTPQDQAP